jgi:hypothetical protein
VTVLPRVLAAFGALALGLGGALVVAAPAAAATAFPVLNNSSNVADPNSLAWAIDQANGVTDGVIAFDMSVVASPLTLTADLPTISSPMTITGPGSTALDIVAPNTGASLLDASGAAGDLLTITGLTLTPSATSTAGIESGGFDLTIDDIVANGFHVSGAFDGSGIMAFSGTLVATNITANGNDQYGILHSGSGAGDDATLDTIEANNNGVTGVESGIVSSSGSISNVSVAANGTAGAVFTAVSGSLAIDHVTANGNAIVVDADAGASVTLTDASSTGAPSFGFLLTSHSAGSELHASRITATSNGDEGVNAYAYTSGLMSISDSTATDNNLDGFALTATDSTMQLTGSLSQNNGLDPCGCGGSGVYLNADNATVTIDSTRMLGNHALFGGGLNASIITSGSTVTVSHSTISGNEAFEVPGPPADGGDGGGIAVAADAFGLFGDDGTTLTISDSVVTNNTSTDYGAGIFLLQIGAGATSTAKVTIQRTTVDGNNAGGYGAGIAVVDPAAETAGLPTVLIDSSTVSNNVTPYGGGGIYFRRAPSGDPAVVKVLNTTVVGNDAQVGGGISVDAAGYGPPPAPGGVYVPGPLLLTTVISSSTIVGNSAHTSGGVSMNQGDQELEIENSIIAGSTTNNGSTPDDLDVSAPVTVSYSLVQHPRAGVVIPAGNGNILGVSPQLAALANNGGTTKTMLVSPGSPAYNTGNPAFAGAGLLDQRGQARVYQVVDMGAVEWHPALAVTGTELTPGPSLVAFLLLFTGLAMVAYSRLRSAA